VEDGVGRGDHHASRLVQVVEIKGAGVNLPGGEAENLNFYFTRRVGDINLLVDAMSGGEDDIVGDQRAATKAGAVDQQCHLVLELAAGCVFAADDAFGRLGEMN
jgi:hypothetical protein